VVIGKGSEMELKVTVAPEDVDVILAKLEKFTKRAEKLGVPPLTLEVSAPKVVKKSVNLPGYGKVDEEEVVTVDVTLTGESPKLSGWALAARLDWIEDAAVLMKVPKVELTKDWTTAKNLCEHCGTIRKRTETFVVKNDAGEEKQVGSDCLMDFLGPNAAAIFGFYTDLIGESESWGEGGGSRYLILKPVLEAVAASIRKDGWVSRTKVYESGGTSTADAALMLLSDLRKGAKKAKDVFVDADEKLADAATAWARQELVGSAKSDYEKNLVAVLKNDYLHPKHVGIAASVIPAYKRHLGMIEEKKNEAVSEYVGEIKKRTEFKGLTAVMMKEFPSMYGVTTMIKFKDAAGNVLVWFASGEKDMEIGKTYDLKATVKAHEEYAGVKQTVLTRAVVL
jgi:hypothetical protein